MLLMSKTSRTSNMSGFAGALSAGVLSAGVLSAGVLSAGVLSAGVSADSQEQTL